MNNTATTITEKKKTSIQRNQNYNYKNTAVSDSEDFMAIVENTSYHMGDNTS